jgi:hypothetical protein
MHFEEEKHINTRHEIHHHQLKTVLTHTIAMLVNHRENGIRAGNGKGEIGKRKVIFCKTW